MAASSFGAHVRFVFKVLSIGAVLGVSLAASFLVQEVVNDRLTHQTQALENKSGDKGMVLVYGKLPGFDEETGVSVYRMVERVLKYAILFIFLTFLAFFLMEVLYKLKLHPMQYLLVGLALAEFYLLLLAFMEQIGFLWAYIIAAIMTIALISLYSHFILKTPRGSAVIAVLLTIIYSYLLVVLHLETLALLAGALLLFVLLAIVMFVTRKLNWYEAFNYVSTVE